MGIVQTLNNRECIVGGRLNKTRENAVEGLRGIKNSAVWRVCVRGEGVIVRTKCGRGGRCSNFKQRECSS